MRRAQSNEGGHEVHTTGVCDAARQGLRFRRLGDEAEAVTQPLHRRARNEDAAFEREHRLAAGIAGQGGEQATLRIRAPLSGVEQQKGARAVGVLGLTGLPAALAVQCGLLIAGDATDRDLAAKMLGERDAEVATRIADLGQCIARHTEELEQNAVPPAPTDVVQHCA